MKLTQFYKDGKACLGIVTEQGTVDVQLEAQRRGVLAPVTMLEAIVAEDLSVLKTLAENAQCYAQGEKAPVVTGMNKILCIGLNYRQHARHLRPGVMIISNKAPDALERGVSFSKMTLMATEI